MHSDLVTSCFTHGAILQASIFGITMLPYNCGLPNAQFNQEMSAKSQLRKTSLQNT